MAIDILNYRWYVNKTNAEYINYISKIASVSPIVAQVLINRGLKTPEQIDFFLNPHLDKLSDPMDIPDMDKAVGRILWAKRSKEKVLICGDYDADGVTATSVMLEGLNKFGVDAQYCIPNRLSDGYGFNVCSVDQALKIGAKLIITVDCGITSFDATKEANKRGIDVIITDHHEPFSELNSPNSVLLPEAVAIVNPKLGALSSQKFLSGAGVSFKILQALFGNVYDIYEFLDLVALGTVADFVPLQGDNRIFLKEGLKLIQSGNRVGLRILKAVAGIKSDFFKPTFLNYILIPRINAAGRISDASDVVKLLTTKNEAEAEKLSLWLNDLNNKRQQIEETVYNEVLAEINENKCYETPVIVVASERWHIGVVGIVASKIAESLNRPALVLTIDNGVAKGSSRSTASFDIHQGLQRCKDLLLRFGGHKQAAGLSLPVENLAKFRARISEIFLATAPEEAILPRINIDVTTKLSDINMNLINEIAKLEPFGCGNEEPLFGAKSLEAINPRIVGNNHLKMYLKQNGRGLDCIGFDFGSYIELIENNQFIDVAFYPVLNEWDGSKYLQLNLKAFRPTKNEDNNSRLY
ncbi:MAG: single-stranded-DNA-specific exonuclease RecJ [Thermodesulfovibrionales bacterium]|nr:single-stranded-DNA-specific exonuclease RecJ [Thermodesulfovibrionales bacterium]